MSIKNEFNQLLDFSVPDWTPRAWPSKKILSGRYCDLALLDVTQHGEPLFDALCKKTADDTWTYLPYGPFKTYKDFQQWFEEIKTKEKDTILYAILESETQQPIGICGYLRINSEHGVIEIGHVHFSKELKKTPAATEAIYLMMHYALEELKYRRYEWKCNAFNEASKRAALRFGFTFEGIFRQCNVFKNHNRDTAWFSILDKEWPDIKKRFERWLHPDNFDAKGQQKTRLQNFSID